MALSMESFASRSAIVHHCRQTFGTGPMALLKQIRLSQVHHALSSPEVQQAIGSYTVQAIDCLTSRLSEPQSLRPGLPQPIRRIPQRHASTGIRSWDQRPIGLRGPKPPDGHGSEVVAAPVGVHRGNRLRGAELQSTGIHLLNNG